MMCRYILLFGCTILVFDIAVYLLLLSLRFCCMLTFSGAGAFNIMIFLLFTFSVAWLKMVANSFSALIWLVERSRCGSAGNGFCSATMRLFAAFVAASILDSFGTLQCCGENSTVPNMHQFDDMPV